MASINEHIDKISVKDDSRIRRESATINGKTYGYLIAEPEAGFTRTLFLIHGFPDLSMAWRYQIPHFLKLGFRVVAPDCIGYGRSTDKDAPTDSIEPYTFKSHAVDFHELCKSLGCESVVVGAHDWGCAIAYRFALEFPSFVTHLFTCAVPYLPTSEKYIPLEVITKFLPSLGYQLQFGSEEGIIESHTQDKAGIRNYLNALYGGRTSDGKAAMTAEKGVELELMPNLSRSVLISEDELDYYVEEYSRHGLRGPCNYYRNRKANWEADSPLLAIEDGVKIKCPTLFVRALGDSIVTDEIAGKMAANVPDYATKNVDASHWLLWQKPEEVNAIVTEWMQGQGLVAASK